MGKRQHYVPECHSTNDLAAQLCQSNQMAEGSLVITEHQTRGKGQQGSGWESAAGQNLTFSLILFPSHLQISDQYRLNKAIALGLVEALDRYISQELCIKWPNDIWVGRQKIAGILIENSIRNTSLQQSIVGIGLNVNQENFSSPKATSMKLALGRALDKQEVLDEILSCIEARYLQLRAGKIDLIDADYLERLYGLNQQLKFRAHDAEFDGMIRGIDAHGRLRVECEGSILTYGVKEITFL
ncbi:MAG TPA: biotin--[acetyl-CoA-carboxylase] ligase [Cyclobacteriaceae bacterium]|nr:biotin--[acetyl-CoA-carboxylase] ligase [Cyclobacteriaceae bacterium]